MKINHIKFFAIVIITLSLFAVIVFSSSIIQSDSIVKRDAAAVYKAQCTVCHTAKAEKFFDPAKTDEVLIEITLKGKKGDKPPYMPGFAVKGMTAEQAGELVAYMKQLRLPNNANTQNANTNVKANANTNANVNSNVNANMNANTNANVNVNANANVNMNANVNANIKVKPDEKAIAEATTTYKTKCAVCHTAKAEKFFDIAKTDEQLVEAVLKGRKGAKPPFMPGYEEKGTTAEQAKALVFYMRQLKISGK